MTKFKTTSAVFLMAIALISPFAQADKIDLDLRGDYNSATFEDSTRADVSRFLLKTVRLDAQGHLSEPLSYRFRATYNKNSIRSRTDNTETSVDYAFVQHQVNPNFALSGGKISTDIGGFEGDRASPDSYLPSLAYAGYNPIGDLQSRVINTSPLLYQTGAKATLRNDNKTQKLALVITNEKFNEDLPDGTSLEQNSTFNGLRWSGFYLDNNLVLSSSYHWMEGPDKNDKFSYFFAGFSMKAANSKLEFDFTDSSFKQNATSRTDNIRSYVARLSYTGIEKWAAHLEANRSLESTKVDADISNSFIGYGLAVEYYPYSDQVFRYHISYSDVTADSSNGGGRPRAQEITLGMRILTNILE